MIVKGKVGLTILVVTIVSLILIVVSACGKILKDTNLDNYLQIKGSGLPGFVIFPENLDNISNVAEYHHIDYQLKDGREIFLDAYYEKEYFYKELNRIENLSYNAFDFPSKKVIKDDSVLFYYTTYITVFNASGVYEYALIDEENWRIVYIALQSMSYDGISFDKKFLPKNYKDIQTKDNYKSYFYYDIYSTKEFY